MPKLKNLTHCPHCGEELPQPMPAGCPACGGFMRGRFAKAGCLSGSSKLLLFALATWWALAT